MPAAVKMTIDERRKYLTIMLLRYVRATKEERGHLLDEMEAVTVLDRKTLIRLLKGDLARHPRPGQRGRTYGPEVDDALRSSGTTMMPGHPLTGSVPPRHSPRTSKRNWSACVTKQIRAVSSRISTTCWTTSLPYRVQIAAHHNTLAKGGRGLVTLLDRTTRRQ